MSTHRVYDALRRMAVSDERFLPWNRAEHLFVFTGQDRVEDLRECSSMDEVDDWLLLHDAAESKPYFAPCGEPMVSAHIEAFSEALSEFLTKREEGSWKLFQHLIDDGIERFRITWGKDGSEVCVEYMRDIVDCDDAIDGCGYPVSMQRSKSIIINKDMHMRDIDELSDEDDAHEFGDVLHVVYAIYSLLKSRSHD